MTIQFSINYFTSFGQTVYICGSIPELGNGDIEKAEPMTYTEDGRWIFSLKIVTKQERLISYKYFVKNSDHSIIYEVGEPRYLAANSSSKSIILDDQWQGNTPTAPFLSAPFSGIFFKNGEPAATRTHKHLKELIIRVTAPLVEADSVVCIAGEGRLLGEWSEAKAIRMTPTFGSKWEVNLNVSDIPSKLEYKFIKKKENGSVVWESGDNHILNIPKIAAHETYSVEHSAAAFPISNPRFAGTAIPVFSIRSKNGYGIGDFSDIKLMVDWAVATKQSILQLLPVNDTTSSKTWTDSYPYGGISIMALHPIYLNVGMLGEMKDTKAAASFEKERKVLNALDQVDYEKVSDFKHRYCRIMFEQNGEDTFAEPAYYTFFKNNKEWLIPYAAFCVLRDKYETADYTKWGKNAKYTKALAEKMWQEKGAGEKMKYYVYVQYQLHIQLLDARNYAHSKGVAIKGDIPIGITPHSVEAWTEPYYFNMDMQAGAPPDAFSTKGQNWGFPTYNWERMEQDGYAWWKRRFAKMAEYFDAYRIDHVLGFFRIWEVPACQVLGLMGKFNPALPYTYEEMLGRGFNFNYDRHATPYIRYYMLKEMFSDRCEYVQNTYLDSNELDVFTLKPEFDTQKKIEKYFEGKDEDNIKDGLMALVGEVLFIEDDMMHGKFHPRISAQNTYSYAALSDGEKSAYNRLYDEFFYTRHNEFWKERALKKLPELISATNMLTCAEDLGMIPACVPEVLSMLRVLTLEIQRMPKDPKIELGNPALYPYLCVCTTGTHDTSTLRGWWKETHGVDCPEAVCESIINEHLNSPAMLAVLPLQDWCSIEKSLRIADPDRERINVPSNPKHYWRFRMHINVEDLIKKHSFNGHILNLIKNSGRNN
ncbi:MAG: 4-alpha-glucanotransferase [Bacteroidales bacterium]|nr:4-alpha-glucanotransferase [Bacteroidales bacterium]